MWSWASSRHCRNGLHAAQNGRLLFFLEEKKQKKIICGPVASLRFCCFRQRVTQNGRLLFFLEEKSVGLRGKRSPADGRTQAHPALSSVGIPQRVCPPSSALSLPVSAAPARQLSRANRPCKRKSSAEQLLLCAFAAFVNVLHKTDGSHTNRPFFRSKQDERGIIFPPKNILPRSVFCFFSSRKENVLSSRKENVLSSRKEIDPHSKNRSAPFSVQSAEPMDRSNKP